MKIAFLNSCAEPSRDGVGDYTRIFANNCISQGNECKIISFNDKYVNNILRKKTKNFEEVRLPGKMSKKMAFEIVKKEISAFGPDWVSLQFIPYHYNSKGIPCGASKQLGKAIGGAKLHIMFHELWIGRNKNARIKEKIIGKIQKFFILKVARNLRPKIISVSSPFQKFILEKEGIASVELPLFGHIPISKKEENWIVEKLNSEGIKINHNNKKDYIIFCLFGNIPRNFKFDFLKRYDLPKDKTPLILSIGFSKRMIPNKTPGDEFRIVSFGGMPIQKISQVIQFSDIGISTTPLSVLEKSSSVKSLIEHGLPIIIPVEDENIIGFVPNRPQNYVSRDLKNLKKFKPTKNKKFDTVKKFIKILKNEQAPREK